MGTIYKKGIPFGGGVSGSAENIAYDETTNVKEVIDGVKSDVNTNASDIAAVNESLTQMTVLENGTDLNTVIAKGDYTVQAPTNIPEEVNAYSWCNVSVKPLANSATYITQILTTNTIDGIFFRACDNGVWKEWVHTALNSDLESVSQNTKTLLLATSTTSSAETAEFTIPNHLEYNALIVQMYGDANLGGLYLYIPKAMFSENVAFSVDTTPYGSAYTLFACGRVTNGIITMRKSVVTGWSTFQIRVFGLK